MRRLRVARVVESRDKGLWTRERVRRRQQLDTVATCVHDMQSTSLRNAS